VNLACITKQIRDDRPKEGQHARLFIVLQFDVFRVF